MRSNSKIELYRNIFTYCFIPGCSNTIGQIHHIVPISKNGKHMFVNFIGLCHDHHYKRKLHKDWHIKQTELLVYKFQKELKILGITSDISEIDFRRHIRLLRDELGIKANLPIENLEIHSCGEFLPQNASEGNLRGFTDVRFCLNCGKVLNNLYYVSDNCYWCSPYKRRYCSAKCSNRYRKLIRKKKKWDEIQGKLSKKNGKR